ncbi:MAG: iron ABC transporter permease [Clostridia bacterium]|nr:iron ABC transporter permease [Clostridia bacterium]
MMKVPWSRRLGVILPALGFLLLVSGIISITIGAVGVSPWTVFSLLIYKVPVIGNQLVTPWWSETIETIIWNLRVPRTLLAAFTGMSLAVAGAAFQGLLRNPLAEPYTVGVSSGAALGAALVIILGLGSGFFGLLLLPIAAFTGAFATILGVYRIAALNGRFDTETLILAGVALSSFLTAILSFLMTLAQDSLKQLIYWLMGSFATGGWDHVLAILPYLIIGFTLIWMNYRELNILTLGEESAGQLGINVERTKLILLFSATLMAGGAVALAGTVGFVGLVVPHVVRLLLGPDHRVLIPAAALTGGIFLVVADTVARTVMAPVELPVGVITAFLGAPFFAYLLRKHRRSRRI